MEKLCRTCKTERQYDEYHNLHKRCIKCNVRCSLKYYYADKDEELEKRKKQYQKDKEKIIDLDKNRRDIQKNETDHFRIKNHNLTQAMETLKTTISIA